MTTRPRIPNEVKINSEARHCTGSPISVRNGQDTNPFRSPPVVLSDGLIISDGKTPRLWLPNHGWRYRRWWTRPAGFSFPIWVSLVRSCLVTPTCLFCCLYRPVMKDLNAGPLGRKIFFLASQASELLQVTLRVYPVLEQYQSTMQWEKHWKGRMAWLAESPRYACRTAADI